MYVGANDIACYMFCPILQSKKRYDIITPKPTLIQKNIRTAFIESERNACLKDSIVTSQKLIRIWDKIWWPVAAKHGIPLKDAEVLSFQAGSQLSDYCKYDISDWMFPTVGVEAESDVRIGPVTLKATADVVKVDLHKKVPTTVLVNFTTQKFSLKTAALDPAIKATAYAFYTGKNEIVTHIAVGLNEQADKIKITTSIFRPKDMEEIRKMLYYVGCSIYSGSYYGNPYLCKECQVCQDFI